MKVRTFDKAWGELDSQEADSAQIEVDESQYAIAKEFGVTQPLISKIVNGVAWSWLD